LAYQYNPLEEEFARGVANAYKLKMQLDSALYFYNIAIRLKIGNYDALQSVGEVLYTQAMMKNPNSPDLNLLTKAYENLSQAFKNKKNASAPLLMGEIKLLQNQTDLARNHFYSFLETYGNVGRGYLGLGKAQLRLNELDSAFMNLQYAIQLEPNNAEAYYYMGTELEKIGKKKEAEQFLNEYLKIINQK
jgi:tetratricopeptide (TPR) repeat protein